jgi:hypothetical protein
VFQGPLGIFDGDLMLSEGGVIAGDVFVSGGDAVIAGQIRGGLAVLRGDTRLAAGSSVTGDVFGLNSDQDVAGTVGGNLTNVSGTIVLRSSAVVEGNLLGWRTDVERERGAQVKGQEMERIPMPAIPLLPGWPERLPRAPGLTPAVPALPTPPELGEAMPPLPRHRETFGERAAGLAGRVFGATFSSLLLIAIGAIIVLIWPRPIQRVSACMGALPLRSLGLGLLTFLIAIGLEVLAALLLAVLVVIGATLSATIILLPIGLLLILLGVLLLLPVPLALLGGTILGWVSLADLLGRKVLRRLGLRSVSTLGAVVAGLALTIWLPALLFLSDVCCIGWPLVVMLISSIGVGSVVLTRFGTRPCFAAARKADEPLPAEAMDEEAGKPDIGA